MTLTRRAGVACTIVVGLALTGCSTSSPGSASSVTSSSSAPVDGTLSSSASAPSGAATTVGIDPCSLLDPSLLAQFGATKGPTIPTITGGSRPCSYQTQTENADEPAMLISVALRDTQGIDSVNDPGHGLTKGHLSSGRQAVEVPEGGGCTLALAVGPSSRVDVVVTVSSQISDKQACTIAQKFADSVDSKLPKG
jgi:hypothetical protein